MGTERQLLRDTGRANRCVYLYVCLRDYSGDRIEGVCLISSRSAGMSVRHGALRKNGLRENADNRRNKGGKKWTRGYWGIKALKNTPVISYWGQNLLCLFWKLPPNRALSSLVWKSSCFPQTAPDSTKTREQDMNSPLRAEKFLSCTWEMSNNLMALDLMDVF